MMKTVWILLWICRPVQTATERESAGGICQKSLFRSSGTGYMSTATMHTPLSRRKPSCPSRLSCPHCRCVTGSLTHGGGFFQRCCGKMEKTPTNSQYPEKGAKQVMAFLTVPSLQNTAVPQSLQRRATTSERSTPPVLNLLCPVSSGRLCHLPHPLRPPHPPPRCSCPPAHLSSVTPLSRQRCKAVPQPAAPLWQ